MTTQELRCLDSSPDLLPPRFYFLADCDSPAEGAELSILIPSADAEVARRKQLTLSAGKAPKKHKFLKDALLAITDATDTENATIEQLDTVLAVRATMSGGTLRLFSGILNLQYQYGVDRSEGNGFGPVQTAPDLLLPPLPPSRIRYTPTRVYATVRPEFENTRSSIAGSPNATTGLTKSILECVATAMPIFNPKQAYDGSQYIIPSDKQVVGYAHDCAGYGYIGRSYKDETYYSDEFRVMMGDIYTGVFHNIDQMPTGTHIPVAILAVGSINRINIRNSQAHTLGH